MGNRRKKITRGLPNLRPKDDEKFNNAPKDLQQAVPKKLSRLMKITGETNENQQNKKTKVKNKKWQKEKKENKVQRPNAKKTERKMKQPKQNQIEDSDPIPEQNPGETDKNYESRLDITKKVLLADYRFEKKFKVELQRNSNLQVVKVAPIEDKRRRKYLLKRRLKSKASKEIQELRKLKSKRRLWKKLKEEEEQTEHNKQNAFKAEKVPFGEVVHAPPRLFSTKLDEKLQEEKKLNVKNFLFIKNLMSDTKTKDPVDIEAKKKKVQSEPTSRELELEQERQRAVFAYRQLKRNHSKPIT